MTSSWALTSASLGFSEDTHRKNFTFRRNTTSCKSMSELQLNPLMHSWPAVLTAAWQKSPVPSSASQRAYFIFTTLPKTHIESLNSSVHFPFIAASKVLKGVCVHMRERENENRLPSAEEGQHGAFTTIGNVSYELELKVQDKVSKDSTARALHRWPVNISMQLSCFSQYSRPTSAHLCGHALQLQALHNLHEKGHTESCTSLVRGA